MPAAAHAGPALLEVGLVVKPHGVRGDVIVDLFTNRPETRVAPGAVLVTDRGPLEVVSSRPHQGRWIVVFAGVVGRDGAEALRGTRLSAEPLDEDGALWVHELIGAEVVDVDGGSHGPVLAVEANPASDLLVLSGDRLVPLTFVVERRPDGTVVIDPPDGLFD
ncbi:MAG TPA: ribosome maturation factor RimM [Acidimicrobiales bacterium]|nr:ribosome maturation factor RimM [Acidimicrobiales bacterium]